MHKYIVEHLDVLGEWCILEYIHICQIVKEENSVFTNLGIKDATNRVFNNQYKPTCFETSLFKLEKNYDLEKMCLLDMKAKETLTPKDSEKFHFLVYGGILGNVPPDDRTSVLRNTHIKFRRNLGNAQMTTDTAVLVSYIILNDKIELEKIPFVDDPEISLANKKESILLPFRFVAKAYYTKKKQDENIPIFPDGFLQYLETLGDEPFDCNDFF